MPQEMPCIGNPNLYHSSPFNVSLTVIARNVGIYKLKRFIKSSPHKIRVQTELFQPLKTLPQNSESMSSGHAESNDRDTHVLSVYTEPAKEINFIPLVKELIS